MIFWGGDDDVQKIWQSFYKTQDRKMVSFFIVIVDDLVKRPDAALRFIPRHCNVP